MTHAVLIKLMFLVVLAFILCLPEFFNVHTGLNVSLRCVRLQLCGEGKEETGVVWSNRTSPEQWQHLLGAVADQRNVNQTDTRCFVCQANVNITELDHNSSSSAKTVYFDTSFTLRRNNTASVNLTVYSYNPGSKYLYLSERAEEEKSHDAAFLHCPPSVGSANHSCCLLVLFNRTFARKRLPWKHTTEGEWRCVLRVTWLSLLAVVLLLLIITVTQQIIEGRRCSSAKLKINHLKHTNQEQQTHVLSVDTRGPYSCSALSPIEEVDTPDETETEVFFSDNMHNVQNVCQEPYILVTPTHPPSEEHTRP